ncbi:integrase [Leptospira weilii]|uniref:integrase n=1 Tax=Leptospira weilii TaxID=28184 RepID=UPI00201B6B24|nr:integrase [Leptospira weilii]UPY80747.1 integrase [Leptospira weilii]
MKVLDLGIVIPLYREWVYAKTVIQNAKIRGEIVQKAIRILGLSKPRVYDVFNRLEKGESVVSVAKVKRKKTGSRLGSLEKELREKEGFALCELMYAGEVLHEQKKQTKAEGNAKTVGFTLNRDYGKSQEFAIELAEKLGKVRPGVWDRHKFGRWLNEKGLARKQVKQPLASITWSEPYANRAWMIDASPLNAVYLHPSKKYLAVRPDLEMGITRIYEGSEDSQLRKVIIYVAVEVYSKTFYVYAYAPSAIGGDSTHGGENSTDWADFFTRAVLPKEDDYIPLQGLQEILYTDGHSAFKTLDPFFYRLGIKRIPHFPGHSKAKGPVESRISAIKRSCEVRIVKGMISNLDELNELLYRYQIHRNDKLGNYAKWLASVQKNPIRAVTKQNLKDAMVSELVRDVDAYGCVSIEARKYLLRYSSEEVAIDRCGEEVSIYKRYDGSYVATTNDGRHLLLDDQGPIGRTSGSYENVGGRKGFRETERVKNRKKALKGAKSVEKSIVLSDVLPDLPEIPYGKLNIPKLEMKTHTPAPPTEFSTVDDAYDWLLEELEFSEEIPDEEIDKIVLYNLKSCKRKVGSIPAQEVLDLVEMIREYFTSKESGN